MDYITKVTKEGIILLTLNLCKEHGTITGKINIAIDEPRTAQSMGEELIQRAFEVHEQSQLTELEIMMDKCKTCLCREPCENIQKLVHKFADVSFDCPLTVT